MTLSSTLNISKDITLDLNGKTLTTGSDVIQIGSSASPAEVTITGDGFVVGTSMFASPIAVNYGHLIIESSSFTSSNMLGATITVGSSFAGNFLTINGGTFDNTSNMGETISSVGNLVVINGGTFNGSNPDHLIYIRTNGLDAAEVKLEVNGGTFNGSVYVFNAFFDGTDENDDDMWTVDERMEITISEDLEVNVVFFR